jgi:hypothetical protein
MKSRWLVGAGALFGFAVGLLVGPRLSVEASASGKGVAADTSMSRNASRNQDDAPNGLQSESRRTGIGRVDAAKKSESKIAIPLSEVSKLVAQHFKTCGEIFGGMSQLEFTERNFEDVFVLMDFSESERESTKAVFDGAATRLRALERSSAKVRKSGPDEFELDLSEVRKASAAIVEEARQDFLKIVPDARGQCIANAIDWDTCVYGLGWKDGKSFPNESISLRIVRQRDGLVAQSHWGRFTTNSPLPKDQYPDDGSPIPSAGLFDARWRPWLSGVSFTPVDE